MGYTLFTCPGFYQRSNRKQFWVKQRSNEEQPTMETMWPSNNSSLLYVTCRGLIFHFDLPPLWSKYFYDNAFWYWVYGEMHYHKKNYFKGGVSESVQNHVHTIDYMALYVQLFYLLTGAYLEQIVGEFYFLIMHCCLVTSVWALHWSLIENRKNCTLITF